MLSKNSDINGSFGCLISPIDTRDYSLKRSVVSAHTYPEEYSIDLDAQVKDQGLVNACVAFSLSTILEQLYKKSLSTNFIYGYRRLAGYEYLGQGMYMRDALSIVLKNGDMLYDDCPGNKEVTKVFDFVENCVKDKDSVERAKQFKIDSYVKLKTEDDIKYSIMTNGPVLMSVQWYRSFKFDDKYKINFDKEKPIGCHAIVVYGWDKDSWYCQNSWGKLWGDKGRFKLGKDDDCIREIFGISKNNGDINVPTNDIKLLDFIFKLINKILNLFKRS